MNIAKYFNDFVQSKPEHIIISELEAIKGSNRSWKHYTAKELQQNVLKIAKYLSVLGIKKGDRVAILSNSRPEWLIADLAILLNGAVSVSVYQTLNVAEVAYILHDSESKVIFAENQEQIDKLLQMQQAAVKIPAVEGRAECLANIQLHKIITFEKVSSSLESIHFENVLIASDTEFQSPDILPNDLASLVYTSGTTGPAKGVMQTHANHLANIDQVLNSGILAKRPSIMIILPLAHSFARLMAYLGSFTGCSLVFPSINDRLTSKFNASAITRDLRDASANIIPIVPRILEKMKEAVEARQHLDSLSAKLLKLTLLVAKKVSKGQASFSDKIIYLLTGFIRNKITQGLFGKDFHFAVSGGAKLYPEVNEFFEALGISILQGYGLTETCVATNINRPGKNNIGTVGPVLDSSIEIKIESDGEILFRGPNVSQGYLNRPQATAESWDSAGWFHTGDLGQLDNDGYLKITGRKKELIVNSYGKKIAPNDIEAKLASDSVIAQVLVVGNDKKYCAALLTVNFEQLQRIAPSLSLDDNDWNENPELLKYLSEHIAKVNSELASYEAIKKFIVLKDNWTVENGFLTPTFKAKRSLIERVFSKEIDSLYI